MTIALRREAEGLTEHRLTFSEFARLIDTGVLGPFEGRVELIDGRIVELAPVSAGHGNASSSVLFRLGSWLGTLARDSLIVLAETTLVLTDERSAEPDVMVARKREQGYYAATDAELVVEIAYSSRKRDFEQKPDWYATAGVVEYWAIDVPGRMIRIHRDPTPQGYANVRDVVQEDARFGPLFAPASLTTLRQLL